MKLAVAVVATAALLVLASTPALPSALAAPVNAGPVSATG